MNIEEMGPALLRLLPAALMALLIFRWNLSRTIKNGTNPLFLQERQARKWLIQRGTWGISDSEGDEFDKVVLKDATSVRIFMFVVGAAFVITFVYLAVLTFQLLLEATIFEVLFPLGTILATGAIGLVLSGLRLSLLALRYEITLKDGVLVAQYAMSKIERRLVDLQSVQLFGSGSAPLGADNVWRMSLKFKSGDPIHAYVSSPGFVDLFLALEVARPDAFEANQVDAMKTAVAQARAWEGVE